jgi:hypothetical protein
MSNLFLQSEADVKATMVSGVAGGNNEQSLQRSFTDMVDICARVSIVLCYQSDKIHNVPHFRSMKFERQFKFISMVLVSPMLLFNKRNDYTFC